MLGRWQALDGRIAAFDSEFATEAKQNEVSSLHTVFISRIPDLLLISVGFCSAFMVAGRVSPRAALEWTKRFGRRHSTWSSHTRASKPRQNIDLASFHSI